jgi:prepilin-type N-terminal cleavage/methylation domain-containing protein
MLSSPAFALPRRRPAHSQGATRAFTLIELLMVIALIGILAAITLSAVRGVKERASIGQAKAELAVLATALESYKRQYGDYPQIQDAEGDPARLYESLLGQRGPGNNLLTTGRKVFIEVGKLSLAAEDPEDSDNYLVDPWGHAYRYIYYSRTNTTANITQRGYVLYSSGPDGEHTLPTDGQVDDDAEGNADNLYANR